MQVPGYSDLTVLGRGGFSTVYRALQESVQRDVALKVLAVHMAGADAKARFRRECATNGRVGTHPNIVTLFDSGFADDGSPYLAMQLCGGGSLSERLRAGGALPVAEVLRIGVKISAALQYAHSAGVLHRDIKPENILISDFGEPELADFGISSVDDQKLSTVTASSFTINHAAPETLAGRPSSVSSDIYSLSSTLFTLVAGHTPFTAPNSTAVVALVNMVMHEPAPRTGRADVPESLERLLAAGLSKTPVGRPGDARAVGSALQRIQQDLGLPVTEFPSAPPPLAFSPTQIFPAVEDEGAAGVGAADAGAAGAGLAGLAGAGPAGAADADVERAIDTGSLPPTGLMPPTGQLPGDGHINTGSLTETGAMPIPGGPTGGPTTGGPPGDATPGPWGDWADQAPAMVNAPPANRHTWAWVSGAAVLVLLAATAVYFFAIRGSSSSNTAGPVVVGSSTRASVTSSAGPSTRTSTSSAPTTRSTTPTTTRSSTSRTTAEAAPSISGFGATTVPDGGEVACAASASVVNISLVWNSSNATKAWIAIDSSSGDASLIPHTAVPTSSSGYSVQFDCSAAEHRFTLTVQNAVGEKTSSSVTYRAKLPTATSSTSRSDTSRSSSTSTSGGPPTTSSSKSTSSSSTSTSPTSAAPATSVQPGNTAAP